MPIAGLAWTGSRDIPRSRREKSALLVSASAAILPFVPAFQPDVRATVCFYATGVHDGKLGQDADAGSLARAKEIRGELLMIFGTKDPHVPDAGRETIDAALRISGMNYKTLLYPAEHAFTRDEGPRFDPEATDLAFAEMIRRLPKCFSRLNQFFRFFALQANDFHSSADLPLGREIARF